jgi:hypothetical protein
MARMLHSQCLKTLQICDPLGLCGVQIWCESNDGNVSWIFWVEKCLLFHLVQHYWINFHICRIMVMFNFINGCWIECGTTFSLKNILALTSITHSRYVTHCMNTTFQVQEKLSKSLFVVYLQHYIKAPIFLAAFINHIFCFVHNPN